MRKIKAIVRVICYAVGYFLIVYPILHLLNLGMQEFIPGEDTIWSLLAQMFLQIGLAVYIAEGFGAYTENKYLRKALKMTMGLAKLVSGEKDDPFGGDEPIDYATAQRIKKGYSK